MFRYRGRGGVQSLSPTCLQASVLRFKKKCTSAGCYKIVEPTGIVGSRRTARTSQGSPCGDRAKM